MKRKKIYFKKSILTIFFSSIVPFLIVHIYAVGYKPKYSVEKNCIKGININRYNNRPLYINNTDAFILTGDKPIARLIRKEYNYGCFMVGIVRKGKGKWLQQCSQIFSYYKAGKMSWKISDHELPGLKINMETLPMTTATGMAIKVSCIGIKRGDKLIWAFGGAQWQREQNLSWQLDVMAKPELLSWGFDPENCKNNIGKIDSFGYRIICTDSFHTKSIFSVTGKCNYYNNVMISEATLWKSPTVFVNSKVKKLPVLCGTVLLEDNKSIYWTFVANEKSNDSLVNQINHPEASFSEGQKRINTHQQILKINTPDRFLNAVAISSVSAIDGAWYPPVFHHGAMLWNVRLPGWRTIFGGTMYGWHNRVLEEAKFYLDAQIKVSNKKYANADTDLLLTGQSSESRFYGIGRIDKDQGFYDMQSQFFDQLIEEYRWTNDPELVKNLRPALELHLSWLKDCFDPDGDGVYESYLNSWPTDSQWYNGGGTAEETSYAYRGHLAARDMALQAGDKISAGYHNSMLKKIKKGFFDKLWINSKGYSGAYREQGGHERLHQDPWLYSIFLPVDAGLTTQVQSIESVYYSEWALQNDPVLAGGRKVWTSNWVPGIWSVRECWPGDNYHLALSYFKAGLNEDGWNIMRGNFMNSAFDHLVPGNLGWVQGGTDFGDCTHTFARALVEGLFGYNPDYPDGKVLLSPHFPSKWEKASIELPDVKIAFRRNRNLVSYTFKLKRPASMDLFLPFQSNVIKNVTVNGKHMKGEILPGIGQSILHIRLPLSCKASVIIETGKFIPFYAPVNLEGNINDSIRVHAQNTAVKGVIDPQGVLLNPTIHGDFISAKLTSDKGYHTFLANVLVGKVPQWRVFRIKLKDPEGELRSKKRFIDKIPVNPNWKTIEINSEWNADLKAIYKQQYLSPRPNTVSARLGIDGYSPWTFPYWKSRPPEITTDNIAGQTDEYHPLITSQGVPFNWGNKLRNIAFTSLWDNYPSKINFPVNEAGRAIYFLVSGSTNVMQCHIPNAVIRLNYEDGAIDSLELVPPLNYWNLSTIDSHATAPGQNSRTDYISEIDKFCMPARLPETVQLGKDCRAMLLNLRLRNKIKLNSVTLETLSQEVVVGIIGITVLKN